MENELKDLKGFLNREKKKNRDLMLQNNNIAEQLKDLEDEKDDIQY